MQEVYSILVRWGPEWDGQSVIYTKSEELFKLLRDSYDNDKFPDFSNRLQAELSDLYSNSFEWQDYDPTYLSSIDTLEAIEWLQCTPEAPFIVLGHTEYTCSINW